MNQKQFRILHSRLSINVPKTLEVNSLPSDTDPTQDIPVKMIEVTASGIPINVRETKGVFSNLHAEQFTAIERRNNDKFDVLGDLQESISRVHGTDVSTNFIKNVKPKKIKQK